MMIDNNPSHHGSKEPHGVSQGIDNPHESSCKVVSNVQHGALLPGVDDPVAPHGHSEQHHGNGGVTASKGGP